MDPTLFALLSILGTIAVGAMPGADALAVDVAISNPALVPPIVERVARMFDVDVVASWLREYTTLPLGAYPNWGKYLRYEWDWSTVPATDEFVAHARRWREEGFQIIGGCCGTRPQEIRALVEAFR